MPHTDWVLSAFVIACCSPPRPVADSEMNTFNSLTVMHYELPLTGFAKLIQV